MLSHTLLSKTSLEDSTQNSMGTSSHINSHLPHPLHRTHYRQLYHYLFKLQPNSLGLQGNLCSFCALSYEFQHLLGLQECHELQAKGSRLYNLVIPPSPENKQVFSVHENVWVEAELVIVNSLLVTLACTPLLCPTHLLLLPPSSMALLPFHGIPSFRYGEAKLQLISS